MFTSLRLHFALPLFHDFIYFLLPLKLRFLKVHLAVGSTLTTAVFITLMVPLVLWRSMPEYLTGGQLGRAHL